MIRRIYTKVLVAFSLTLVAVGASVFVITMTIGAQPPLTRWLSRTLDLYARTAVDLYDHGGATALATYLRDIERSSGLHATLLDPHGSDILGVGVPREAEPVLADALAAGQSRFRRGVRSTGASVVPTATGTYILVAVTTPNGGVISLAGGETPLLRIAIALAISGILCLLLARHIATPIHALRVAADRIADGDLTVRAAPAMAGRNDELADLARDFDRMADRIQLLVEKQQQLLGDISHELRSPLTRLTVSLELVRRGDVGAVDRMQGDLDHLDRLIGQILTLTRLQMHAGSRSEAPLDLRSVLESVAEDARFEGRYEGKSVVVSHADACRMRGDPALLRSCLENVIRNAVRYTKPGTDVVIQLHHAAQSARVVVADDGHGVLPDDLPRLFEPFYRVGGHGLGLSIARRIVVLHGGTITARNRPCGGLEVEMSFPA